MEKIGLFLKYLLILALSVLIGTFLLIAVYKLPIGRATKNVISSINYLGGDFPDWSGNIFTVSDGFTDLIMINTSIFNGRDNATYYALQNPHIEYKNEFVQYKNLLDYLNERENPITTPYPRYWHGYVIILKPLLAFFTVQDIRLLNSIIQGLLFLLLLYLLNITVPRNSQIATLGYGLSLFMICPFTISLCFQYSTVYYIILLSCITMILLRKFLQKNGRFGLFFYFVGIVTAYFDFLTYPAAVLGFGLTTYLLIQENNPDGRTIKSVFSDAVRKSIAWIAGYGLMWSSKWIVAELLTGTPVISNALQAVQFRTSNNGLSDGFNLFEPISEPVAAFMNPIIIFPVAIFLLLMILIHTKRYMFDPGSIRISAVYLFIACYPFVWCSVLRNHSVQHPYIVYRLFSLTFLGIFVFLSQIITEAKSQKERTAKDEQR